MNESNKYSSVVDSTSGRTASYSQVPTSIPATLESILIKASEQLNALMQINSDLYDIKRDLIGSTPEACGSSDTKEQPENGKFDSMVKFQNRIDEQINRTNDLLLSIRNRL